MIPIFYVNYDLENMKMKKTSFEDVLQYDSDESYASNVSSQEKTGKERKQPKTKDVYDFNNTNDSMPDINFPSNPRKINVKSVNNKQEKSRKFTNYSKQKTISH